MLEQLSDEKRLVNEGKPGSGTLMSNLVRASSDVPNVGNSIPKFEGNDESKPLTTDEILGNIFVYNFAGHDTTAIPLAYSMLLLVAHPEVQDWMAEELKFYLQDANTGAWTYEEVFPKLQRCLAVLVRKTESIKLISCHCRKDS